MKDGESDEPLNASAAEGGSVATGEQLKALLKSHVAGDEERFRAIALQIAAGNAKKGKTHLAEELRRLLDEARRTQGPPSTARAVPIARPVGELAGLVTASYPNTRLFEMVLADAVRASIAAVIEQYRQRDRLRAHGLSPKRKLLLVGPPGCGKTMTASVLAAECNLPLMFVQLHGLITKYMGETAAKLHIVFDAMAETRGVYLFDEFDAIGATRSVRNDVGEIRRVLNSFLQFLERDDSESIVVAATNLVGMLDDALFRRFDDVIRYELPDGHMVRALVENRLSSFDIGRIRWPTVTRAAAGLSPAEITRACDDAAKESVLSESDTVATVPLAKALERRRRMHPELALEVAR